jgi:hypothetical protein
MAGPVPGTLLPDTARSVVVVSQDGELAAAVRDAVDPAMALVRDVRPAEAAAGVAACRPWPWVLCGDVATLPPSVLTVLRRLPVLVMWLGPLPQAMPAHATGYPRFALLGEALGAACGASVGGMRLALGLGVVMADGRWEPSASLQALVSLSPAGFAVPRHAFRGAASALVRHGSDWRPVPLGDGGAITLTQGARPALVGAS